MNVNLSLSLLLGQRLAMQPGLVEAMQGQELAWGAKSYLGLGRGGNGGDKPNTRVAEGMGFEPTIRLLTV
jgi:hypothetical protein